MENEVVAQEQVQVEEQSQGAFLNANDFAEILNNPQGDGSPDGGTPALEQPLAQGAVSSEQAIAPTDTPAPIEAPIESAPIEHFDWKKEIASQPIEDVLAALGLDPKISALVSKYQETGDVTPYLNAIGKDWSKVPATDLLKEIIKEEYPDFTSDEIEEEYASELSEYDLGEDASPREQKKALAKIEKRVSEYRSKKISENEALLIPKSEPKPKAEVKTDADFESSYNAKNLEAQNYIKDSLNAKPVLDIITSNSIAVGEGNEAYSFALDGINEKMEYLTNPEKLTSVLYDEKGAAKPKENILASLFLSDMNGFINKLIAHGKKLGTDAYHNELENASPLGIQAQGREAESTDMYEHAARTAVLKTYN